MKLRDMLNQLVKEDKRFLTERKSQKIKTRFGVFEIAHSEEPTAPGYDPMYTFDVKLSGQLIAGINVEGDPRDNPYNAKISIQTFKSKIKVKK